MFLTEFLYVLPEHPMSRVAEDFKYLSVRKVPQQMKLGGKIFLLYRKSKKNPPGIIGYCDIAGPAIRVRDIPKEERHLCYNRSLWQIPVKDIRCAIYNIIDERTLYALPGLNEWGKYRVYRACSMIDSISIEISMRERSPFWPIWRARRSQKELDEYNELYVHLSREKAILDHKIYCRLMAGINKCAKCGFTHPEYQPYTPEFFELHEHNVAPITTKYQKVDRKNLIPLCPNCHKLAHEKMLVQAFADREYGYTWSDAGICTGWNVEAFKDQIE